MMDFESNKPYEVSEVICIRCGKRWIAVRPRGTLLKELECSECGIGFVINTGQPLNDIVCDRCVLWQHGKCKLKLSHNIYDAELCEYYKEK